MYYSAARAASRQISRRGEPEEPLLPPEAIDFPDTILTLRRTYAPFWVIRWPSEDLHAEMMSKLTFSDMYYADIWACP